MTSVAPFAPRGDRAIRVRPLTGIGASVLALGIALFHAPVIAQTSAILRASAGLTTPVVTPAATLPVTPIAPNVAGMTSASARAMANQAAATNAAGLAAQANSAARAAALAAAQTIPNGLVTGGLVPVADPVLAALDPTGLRTWQGASAPVQTGDAATPTVTVTQTAPRALLTWSSFNIGRGTTLEFRQQADWVVVNRITANIDRATGRIADFANLRPSTILGAIKGDGTVIVINQNGVMFGGSAQVNTRSFVASSLEIGAATRRAQRPGSTIFDDVPNDLSSRAVTFLQNGLLSTGSLVSGIRELVRLGESVSTIEPREPEGAVTVAAGAAINGGAGGFVIIAAPTISVAGQLSAAEGQVSLQSGRQVLAQTSSGSSDSIDPEVRGLVLTSIGQTPDGITIAPTALIEAPRGYLSIGTTSTGTISSAGVLRSTTSVDRNGKIVLAASTVSLAPGSTIAITPDTGTATIPQSAESVAAFKRSVINIGGADAGGVVSPSRISIGANTLIYAPSARVSIGATNDLSTVSVLDDAPSLASSLSIAAGATIDVGGIKDFVVPASRNSIQITPVKRNELRDTPNYRETTTDGSFTLNGTTLFVDPRLSGVRADGVAWVGSPLIEAGSYFAQIGVTAAELMTVGGDLTLGVRSFAQGSTLAPASVNVAAGAVIDVSGGWVRYEDGVVQTSRLRTVDGRIVAIGAADPNDNFIGVVDAITATQDRFGFSQSFANTAQPDGFEPGYTEGRDAGSLTIKASTNSFAGTLHGDAFAGTRQLADGREPDRASTIASDVRRLQSAPSQLPTGGLLKIAAIGTNTSIQAGGADIIVYGGRTAPARPASEILVSDAFVAGSGMAQLALQTSGQVILRGDSVLALPAGGALVIDAGRSVRFDGRVDVASGTISARTYEVVPGSVFRRDDDLPEALATGLATPRFFDINVNGLLSTRGRWSNDFLVADGAYLGGAYADGGRISLEVAPRVLIPVGDGSEFSADLSGSLFINASARLDVSGGGHVRPDGTLVLNGRGGDVALINRTTYAQILSQADVEPGAPARLSDIDVPQFLTTATDGRQSGLAPRALESQLVIAPNTIVAQGFTGGGTFTLVTPDLNFGARSGATGTALPLDFITSSGFGAFSLTTYSSRLLPNVFSNGLVGNIALFDTEVARVAAGETLNLTQTVINSLLDDGSISAARNLATGGDVRGLLGTGVPVDAWDRLAVDLRFGGLTEVDVAAGGLVTGSDGAALTVSKLRNAGTIRIAGGTVRQEALLPAIFSDGQRPAIGVTDLASVFGARDTNGLFDENALNARSIRQNSSSTSPILTNAELASFGLRSRPIYFTASLAADEGVRLVAGSVTDLSGASIRNPRAGARPGGEQKIDGRIVGGGTLETAFTFVGAGPIFAETPQFGDVRYADLSTGNPVPVQRGGQLFNALPGSTIDLRGAADSYDLETSLGVFTPSPLWSDGGRLTLGTGGTTNGAAIFAAGGAAAAEGGVLTWLNPVLRQLDAAGGAVNVVAADQIIAAGFDSFVAQQRLTTLGNATLRLRRGFYLDARQFDGNSNNLDSFRTTLATGGNLLIEAAYIHLSSPQQTALFDRPLTGPSGQVTLNAQTIDIIGSVYADASVTSLTFNASGDVRLTGVKPTILSLVGNSSDPIPASLGGQLVVNGDLTINAAQVYPTTGTGSLQQDITAQRDGTAPTAVPYLVASTGADSLIRISRSGTALPATPYSAGTNLLIQAARIAQDGVLRAPLGRLTLGANAPLRIGTSLIPQTVPATRSLVIGAGSTTSVSANGLNIPYGTTTDLIEYFFTPASDARLFAPPAAELRLAGVSVDVRSGATVDASGGGDLYAYEFAAGVGGSRDVLSRFNSDAFSGNNGLQFADGRQVYAIVPSLSQAGVAPIDPVYSEDYGALYNAADAGRRVFLEAAPGLEAGWYTLLPARYALLPGGMRVVENSGEAPPAIGQSTQLRDGSLIVGGRYGVTGTGIESSQRRTFTVQSQESFRQFSTIALTQASTTFADLATRDGLAVPRLPGDAARLVLAPLTALSINTRFLTAPATGGRGAQVDISGNSFEIVVPGSAASPDGVIRLTTTDFGNLNAASLLIGGTRTENSNGTTSILPTTQSIQVANNAANPLSAAEVILVVDGPGSTIEIVDGAAITATGTLSDSARGNYVIDATLENGLTGIGGIVRVANGAERLVDRPGSIAFANSLEDSSITIGEARLTGQSILLDSSRDLVITDNPLTTATPLIQASASLALGGDDIFFTTAPSGFRGLVVTPQLETQFAAAGRLTVTTRSIIGFSEGPHAFNDLTIDARGIRPYGQAIVPLAGREDQFDVAVPDLTAAIDVTITANAFRFANSDIPRTPCGGTGTPTSCGTTSNTLTIAADSIAFQSGTMGILGFDRSVTLTAAQGVFVEGSGTLDVGPASLTVNAPFVGDRALSADPRGTKVQPSLGVLTDGAVVLNGAGTLAGSIAQAPGATLTFGTIDRPVASFSASDIIVRATAGVIDVRANGNIATSGTTLIATPGYARNFGDAADAVLVSAPGGYLSLVSKAGDVALGSATTLSIGGGSGNAGTLQLSAALGRVVLPGTIDAAAPGDGASLTFNSGTLGLDLAGFLAGQGRAFTGDVRIRTGSGNLAINAGQTLNADSLKLVADGGRIDIAGTIDTSGINGGAIGLYGTGGVTLAGTALINARAEGYPDDDTRAATGGRVDIGTAGTGTIVVASGARIDVAARRSGARLVSQIRKDAETLNDTITYNYAQSDAGGIVAFRAPILLDGAGLQTVAISHAGTITGARETSVEAYRVFDLATMARPAGCVGADICINSAGQAVLDLTAAPATNRLGSTVAGGVPDFIRTFNLTAARAGLGALADDPGLRLRPGVDLHFAGDIILASNWNLGAATVNTEAAIADGLMAVSPHLGPSYRYVVPGSEDTLFSGFSTSANVFYTDFTYRVGGRATNEAPVLTLRAGGNLDIRGTVSDGFFNFADATDAAYLSFQLGGGNRQYRPAFELNCAGAVGSCTDIFETFFFSPGSTTPPIAFLDSISIVASRLVRGQGITDLLGPAVAPYSAAANAPGALGTQANGAGDPTGSAVLVPLLADGSAATSTSLRFVGGAAAPGSTALPVSADPLAVAPSSPGKVSVSGGGSYRAAPIIEPQRYVGGLELYNFDPNQGVGISAPPGDFIAALTGLGVEINPAAYTRLTLTGASPTIRNYLVTQARAFFAANNIPADGYQFFGPPANPASLATTADLMARFFASIATDFAGRIGTPGFTYAPPVLASPTTLSNPNISTRSLVRTGTGTIDIAAAGDVDLTNGRPVFRTNNGRTANSGAVVAAQDGGAAIYTAGHRASLAAQAATVTATDTDLQVAPAYLAAPTASGSFQPNVQAVQNGEPVYATGGGDITVTSGRDVAARRDAWSEAFRSRTSGSAQDIANAGTDTQLWRVVSAPVDSQRFVPITNIRINPQLFASGVGALGGGSVSVRAERNVSELTAVSDTSITTGLASDASLPAQAPALTLISYGGGNVDVRAGGDVRGSQVDVASGQLAITAGGAVTDAGTLRLTGTTSAPLATPELNLLRVRVADATATISAVQSVTIGGIASTDGEGFFGRTAGISVLTNGDVIFTNRGKDIPVQFSNNNNTQQAIGGALLPGSLEVSALFGDIDLANTSLVSNDARRPPVVLVPSPAGRLKLLAGGDLAPVTLVMDDGDPSLTPGPLSAATQAALLDIQNVNPNLRLFGVPVILPLTGDADRRRLHNERPTHADNPDPVRIAADGDIAQLSLFVPKATRIAAGGDISDMIFVGQHLGVDDVTRITAGGDIIATSRVLDVATATGNTSLPVQLGNNIVLGGPGALFVEAGRDLGPFFNSAITADGAGVRSAYAGGIITVGNDYNPWLRPAGAKIYAQFGVGKGADYASLASIYVDPANVGDLDGDLFVQSIDANGNRSPDRDKPIYATALVSWLVENAPDAITAAFGARISLTPAEVLPLLASLDATTRAQFLTDLPFLAIGGGINSPLVAIDRRVETAPVLLTGAEASAAPPAQQTNISGSTLVGWLAQNAPAALTARFGLTSTDINRAFTQLAALPELTRRQFLLDRVYFNELAAPSRPGGASSGQFLRGYQAVETLFPAASGYTDNLATYDLTLDPPQKYLALTATPTVPLLDSAGNRITDTAIADAIIDPATGRPINYQALQAVGVLTGNLDLRLATLETQRGGDVSILGPGGRVLGGSIVATSAQASRRGANIQDPYNLFRGQRRLPGDDENAARILAIPTGFEGVLTLRGGGVRGFVDDDFLLNQSRLFTVAGGDITLWSSNGDLNAGQGVKTTANNPPVVVRFDPNGFGVLDQAGAVAGAGIAGFQPAGVDKAPDITLVAPVGTVDAGDAGVRASGNVFVAAARVANADNFKVGGTAFGNIAATTVDTGAAASANAASAAASQAAAAVNPSSGSGGSDRSRISVEVLGFAGSADEDPCNLPAGQRPPNCPVPQR